MGAKQTLFNKGLAPLTGRHVGYPCISDNRPWVRSLHSHPFRSRLSFSLSSADKTEFIARCEVRTAGADANIGPVKDRADDRPPGTDLRQTLFQHGFEAEFIGRSNMKFVLRKK